MTQPPRKSLSQTDVLAVCIQQGAVIPCYRCRKAFTNEDVETRNIECEHLVERELGGGDGLKNRAFSHKRECHKIATNGTRFNRAGSSKHKIAKAKGKVKGGHARAAALSPERRSEIASKAAKTRWGKRKIPSRPFPKKGERKWPKK